MFSHLKQYADVARLLLKYGDADLVAQLKQQDLLNEEAIAEPAPDSEGEDLARDLERLGPTWVKLGQFLSTRTDFLPRRYTDSLSRLQDEVEPTPFERVEAIVEEELQVRLSKAFQEFESTPVASASLGQVHHAILRDGRHVAVKVQRPDIGEQVQNDLEAFQEIAETLERHFEMARQYMIAGTVAEFREAVLRELDYRREAENIRRLRRNLREFDSVIVPEPVDSYTTHRVLTMEFVSGAKVTSISPLRQMEIDSDALADELLEAYLKQILVDGFFHADPHPGNVFLTSDNRIALLDFGMVGAVPSSLRPDLMRLLLAIIEGDGSEASEALLRLGQEGEQTDRQVLQHDVSAFLARYAGAEIEQLQTGRMVLELLGIAGAHHLRMPREFVMIGKTLMNLDKVGSALSAEFRPDRAIRKHAMEILSRQQSLRMNLRTIYNTLIDSAEFMERLPDRANRIAERLARGEFRFCADVFDERYFMVGLQKIANRLTLGMIIAGLIVGAALLANVETEFTIFGYPGISMIFFLIASLAGLALSWRILFTDEHTRREDKRP